MKTTTCCFTGHRPEKLPWGENELDPRCGELKKRMAREVIAAYNNGYRRFLCGMARGADIYFCEAVLHIRDSMYGDIVMEAALPCDRQTGGWSDGEILRYEQALKKCDVLTYVSHDYFPGCMMKRNRYMADQASLMIAVYNGMPSGTMNTVLYGIRGGMEVIIIDPESF